MERTIADTHLYQTPHWLTLSAEIRPHVDRLGIDGETLDYLVDAVDRRNGADIDEYRALQSYAKLARALNGRV